MTLWFGEPWPSPDYRAPVCRDDADRIDTPFGAECYICHEPIVEGDQGTVTPLTKMENGLPVYGGLLYDHKECLLRNVLGCYGNLVGEGHTHDVPYRDDARRVQDWVQQHRE